MKCEICGKEILRDSQCINYKYYHNDCIENLQQENIKLKNWKELHSGLILAKENIRLHEQNKKQKEVIDKAINELFILKDMIYKPETREENFEIQRKISSIIKRLNGKEVSK